MSRKISSFLTKAESNFSFLDLKFLILRKAWVPTPIRFYPNDLLSRQSLFLTGWSFQIWHRQPVDNSVLPLISCLLGSNYHLITCNMFQSICTSCRNRNDTYDFGDRHSTVKLRTRYIIQVIQLLTFDVFQLESFVFPIFVFLWFHYYILA